jgi:hypothetical protein
MMCEEIAVLISRRTRQRWPGTMPDDTAIVVGSCAQAWTVRWILPACLQVRLWLLYARADFGAAG